MSMMGMTAVLICIYFVTMTFIALYADKTNVKYINTIFIAINILSFLSLYVYHNRGSGKIYWMTFDNISPFTFTMISIMMFLKGEVKQHFKCVVAFLSVGMIIAMMITPQHAYLFSFLTEAKLDYLFDAISHLNCSLFGIYLVSSGQVKLTFKNFLKSVVFMYIVIAFVVILNYIFHTNFFGMCPYGGYSIYMFNLFEEYWATLLAYVLGVFVVLAIGFEFNYALNKLSGRLTNENMLNGYEIDTVSQTSEE